MNLILYSKYCMFEREKWNKIKLFACNNHHSLISVVIIIAITLFQMCDFNILKKEELNICIILMDFLLV